MTTTATSAVRARFAVNPVPLAIAATLTALGALFLAQQAGSKLAVLYLIGALLGVTLYHAAFGFTSSWRVFIADGRGTGLRAQMLMLAVGVALFFPVLAEGTLFGNAVSGSVSPAGTSVVVGAFIFGIGMQLGGGCASGTLYTAGGGSIRMVITLAAFIFGSLIGTAHMPFWTSLPQLERISLVKSFGALPALLLCWAVFALIAWVTVVVERRRHGQLVPEARNSDGLLVWLRGPWPLVAGALLLVLLNFATLAVAGRPWGVTGAFALWGAKLASAVGIDVASWTYWASPANAKALAAPVWEDVTSVMDIGIVLGAMAAAAVAGRYAPQWRLPLRSVVAAIVGGLLLGYGARLAYGCNIGAYFSGILSGSLHGWLWLVAAFIGNVVGTRLRPAFGLAVERVKPSAC